MYAVQKYKHYLFPLYKVCIKQRCTYTKFWVVDIFQLHMNHVNSTVETFLGLKLLKIVFFMF